MEGQLRMHEILSVMDFSMKRALVPHPVRKDASSLTQFVFQFLVL